MTACAHCKTAFEPARSTAKFCSTHCRVTAHRAKGRRTVKPELLKKTASQQVAREKSRLQREYERKEKALQASFNQAVVDRFNLWRNAELAHVVEKEAKLAALEQQLHRREQDVTAYMTRADFKFVLGCLHPDHPERGKDRLQKAFNLFKKLEVWTEQHGKAELRRRGWV